MPCDTPPPPSPLEQMNNDENIEELDESMYDFIEVEELENMPDDDSLMTFSDHTNSVFTCNFDRTGQYAVTGSQDETAFVWSVPDGIVQFECTGHKDSVIFANFSPDSKYVASVDMSGVVKVFDMNDGSLVWTFDTFEFTWADWLNGSNVLVAGSMDGNCWKWSIPDGALNVFENSGIGSSTGAVSNNDEKLAAGYSDGTIKFWDLTTNSRVGSLQGAAAFKKPVTVIKFSPDNSLTISASEDGTVKLIRMSDFRILWTIIVCDTNDHAHEDVSVETVGFCNTPSLVAVGTNCGLLAVYDISSRRKRFTVALNSAIVKVVCDGSDPILYAALAEGIVQAYDIRTGVALKTWAGHRSAILDLAISSDRTMLITSSDDLTCKIFVRGALLT